MTLSVKWLSILFVRHFWRFTKNPTNHNQPGMPIPSAAHLPKSTGKFQDFGVSKLPEFSGPEILQRADRLKGFESI